MAHRLLNQDPRTNTQKVSSTAFTRAEASCTVQLDGEHDSSESDDEDENEEDNVLAIIGEDDEEKSQERQDINEPDDDEMWEDRSDLIHRTTRSGRTVGSAKRMNCWTF